MAFMYRDVRTGVVREVAEPKEVEEREGDESTGRWKAMHQRRTLAAMDASSRWERVTDTPSAPAPEPAPEPEPEPAPAAESGVERPAVADPKAAWVDYAVAAHGWDRNEAEATKKADLTDLGEGDRWH
jgi:hypothetical protein